MSLKSSTITFTRDEIAQAASLAIEPQPQSSNTPRPYHDVARTHVETTGGRFNVRCSTGLPSWGEIEPRKPADALGSLSEDLVLLASDAENHFGRVDNALANLITVELDGLPLAHIVQETHNVLTRLPAVPPKIDLSYAVWGQKSGLVGLGDYFHPNVQAEPRSAPTSRFQAPPWPELLVVQKVSTVTLRVALVLVTSGGGRLDIASSIRKLLDIISELMDSVECCLKSDPTQYRLLPGHIVKAFLWNTWQRCLMLHFWYVLLSQIRQGFNPEWNEKLALRGMSLLMHPSVRATLYGWDYHGHKYMCSRAFVLLKSNRATLGLDFRHFHQRFGAVHHDKPARCLWEIHDDACDGSNPLLCGRFCDSRLVKDEQSIHDNCDGKCSRFIWDRSSFTSVTGPTALSLSCSSSHAKYVQASWDTMAISHVWSHGYGGRPHTGINMCLHRCFANLAKKHGCTSYWMDTMCIPEDHDLRKEAISHINTIFSMSKVTLIIDRDLMSLDITDVQINIPHLESILSTFLVCDWNVRAWTLLEATRGCHNLHLLCASNKTLSLRTALTSLHERGSIDIAILFLAAQHLLPSSPSAFRRTASRTSLEVAGSILAHRHATRPGDDVVIWSLLSSIHVSYNAEEMWRRKINNRIKQAYLMSSTSRLQNIKGFGWAPSTPYLRQEQDAGAGTDHLGPFLTFDGADSDDALITAKGLLGTWRVYRVEQARDAERFRDAPVTMTSFTADGGRIEKVLKGHRIKNPCWEVAVEFARQYRCVVLIQPTLIGVGSRQGERRSGLKGESHGPVFALCTSDDGEKWLWQRVMAWPRAVPVPEMELDELLII